MGCIPRLRKRVDSSHYISLFIVSSACTKCGLAVLANLCTNFLPESVRQVELDSRFASIRTQELAQTEIPTG